MVPEDTCYPPEAQAGTETRSPDLHVETISQLAQVGELELFLAPGHFPSPPTFRVFSRVGVSKPFSEGSALLAVQSLLQLLNSAIVT